MSRRPDPKNREAGETLCRWYEAGARDLPWRREISPYRVLVSEVMLQQTRLETVKPRFEQFLRRFPDVETLAAATEDEVMKLWEGLGYYTRARNLHKAAKVLAAAGGVFPETSRELQELPGVGEYTGAAVAAITFKEPVVALDANAVRIALRFIALPEPPSAPAAKQAGRQCLEDMMPAESPDIFAQAVMELGQTVCMPRTALCGKCPLKHWCAGKADPLQYPARRAGKPKPELERTVAVVCSGGRVALQQRPAKGLLAGLWAPISWSGSLTAADVEACLRSGGFDATAVAELEPWRHEFTHQIWHLRGWLLTVPETESLDGIVWTDRRELEEKYAVPTAFRPAITQWERTYGKTGD